MDEITIHETREVLRRLVRERKALEKGLEAAERLSDIEINIVNREKILDGLVAACDKKQSELIEIDENISEIHQKREAACVKREKESAAKLELEASLLEDLKSQYSILKVDFDNIQAGYAAAHKIAMDNRNADIAALDKQISDLRGELASLQKTARALAGV